MSFEFDETQETALDSMARRTEAARLTPIMRTNLPEATEKFNEKQLEDTIFAALERSHEWKVKTHAATVDFVILWILLGPDFDRTVAIESFFVSETAEIDTQVRSLMTEFKWHLHKGGVN